MSESSMPSIKRTHDGSEKEKEANLSPFMPMFETFRDELDEHHDRRERVIKTSRDITAASKKIIFALQRYHVVRTLKSDIPEKIAKEVDDRASAMQKQMEAIAPDLAGINAWRYQRQISDSHHSYRIFGSFTV
ncbi:putative Translin-associated protein X [Glarea lozoyensis 74030]|uniref:Putative Translin-associated protein X n=1 Tax=Glarea lozoyensis (strain ATCC 74030 / MF5533) TaxID=1104152 RepID=H0EXD6_GLAL7|nr:putative Translin-associated protein X [Glarea lozoyensis 74030]